ncbi:uncharacterized protein LOC119574483 [Penaeus monodon]|uniref:uncharacterized protein LOC119574483 n=1 Tax=Penaeus monodon TaxID=6687 RepID=UPI0018A6F039|nr:uncharacterized protein LOC119574483 [Penaeus monodon]
MMSRKVRPALKQLPVGEAADTAPRPPCPESSTLSTIASRIWPGTPSTLPLDTAISRAMSPPTKKREGAAAGIHEEKGGNVSKIQENASIMPKAKKGEERANNVRKAKNDDQKGEGEGRTEEHGETPRPDAENLSPPPGTDAGASVPRCLQPQEAGPCRASFLVWAYDAASETCVTFIYGGCKGNDNNFMTEQQCLAACPDEVPCPEDTSKVCRVSETSCRNASCPANELAACRVTPCTCDVSFVSEEGEEVDCHKADAVEAADGPEGRGGDVDVAEGSGSGGTNPTDEPSAGDGGDGGASERGRLEGETEKNKTTGDDAEDVYQQAGLWIGVSVGVIILLAGAVIAVYKWRGNNRSYAIFLLTSAEDFSPCDGDGSKFTEYSSITA